MNKDKRINKYIVSIVFYVLSFIELFYLVFAVKEFSFTFYSIKYLIEAMMFLIVAIFWIKKIKLSLFLFNVLFFIYIICLFQSKADLTFSIKNIICLSIIDFLFINRIK